MFAVCIKMLVGFLLFNLTYTIKNLDYKIGKDNGTVALIHKNWKEIFIRIISCRAHYFQMQPVHIHLVT